MATLRIPTPLRPYTEGQGEVEVRAEKVSAALDELIQTYPALQKHLFTEEGELRAFVNLFLNEEDVRHLKGVETELNQDDSLMIIPSIAGGLGGKALSNLSLQRVDHAALRTNQAFIIGLSVAAFVIDAAWLAAFVGLVMLWGTARKRPGFGFVYRRLLKPRGWVQPDVLDDNPEPHRFAQGFGGAVLAAAGASTASGAPVLGWALVWLVAALAALNLFGGFCVGCAIYYWLNRLRVPGFVKAPPDGAFPGMRPQTGS